MNTTLRRDGQTADSLLRVALDLFAERGYRATTTRDIAAAASLSSTGLYVHFASKEDVLFQLSRLGHQEALMICSDAVSEELDPLESVASLVQAFATWHAEQHKLARVVQYELDALAEEHRVHIVELRRQTTAIFHQALQDGVECGAFEVDDLSLTALALMSLCIDICRWYNDSGEWTPAGVGERYSSLAVRMLAPRASVTDLVGLQD